jgi:phosphoribosylaminoimidazole-succinocarboxamide synthase
MDVVLNTEIPEIVVTDRVSAFDVIMPNGIPGKGKVLTAISLFWFEHMKDVIENHIIASRVEEFPEELHRYRDMLEGRSVLVKKASVLPVECIVRGYLSGSGWKSYQKDRTVCGIVLPAALEESSKLPEPVFTPSTKADEGHDMNIPFEEMEKIVGREQAAYLSNTSLAIYEKASAIAEERGIIIADTKMEFGIHDGRVILIDELLTPDSSRFWSREHYGPGRSQDSFDKQIVRDYLLTLEWDQTPPGPELPDPIVTKTSKRYQEILSILTG